MSSNNSKDVILYPNKFNISDWSTSLELWNKGNVVTTVNNNGVHKTIYSASPNSYVEPMAAAFTGFKASGPYNNGWNLYCLPNSQGSTIFFAALGNRQPDTGTIVDVRGGGFYWLAGPAVNSLAYYMDSRQNYVITQQPNLRHFGFSLRSSYQ